MMVSFVLGCKSKAYDLFHFFMIYMIFPDQM